ncbi:MAG TPA: hypothetical protein VLV78_02240 [Thermoanaerobaculia bacterium]|nr:hypothetical protein [Thermoanaerobaculia bacterium]
MASKKGKPISFDISKEHQSAIEALAGSRRVRLSGHVAGGKLVVDFVACNAAFVACNAAFTACNSAFTACNSAFTACNAAFSDPKKK